MNDIPYMKLFVGDYIQDTPHLSCEQHGAYLLLLMAMWTAGGKLPSEPAKLARIARLSLKRWQKIQADIMPFFVQSGAVLTQKRLAKELEHALQVRKIRSDEGKKGGRPNSLKYKEHEKPIASDLESKPESSHSHSQNSNYQSSASIPFAAPALPPLEAALRKEAGLECSPAPLLADTSPISRLVSEGYSLENHILPKIRAMRAARAGRGWDSWGYVEKAVRKDIPLIAAGSSDSDAEVWKKRIEIARRRKEWDVKWGPMPRKPGCRVPAHLLEPTDGQGWQEWKSAA